MAKKKVTKLDMLFTLALTSGLFLAVQIHTGLDISEEGIALMVVEKISESVGNPNPYLIPIISIGATLTNAGVTLHHVKTASQHGHRGAIVSGGGFFGMLALVLGSLMGIDLLLYAGVISCLAGGFTSGVSR